jgi:hypothetical protein
MKSFDQYMIIRSLAETIVHYNIDADHICESIILQIQEDGVDAFNEAWFGVPQAARAVSGVVGGLGGMAKDAAGAVGGMFQKAGQYVSDKYAAGARAQAAKQVEDRLKGLADAMVALGIDQQHVKQTLQMVQKVVAAGGVKPDMTRAGASRQGRQDAFNRMRSMRDQAQKTQAQPQAQAQNPWSAGMSKMQQQKPGDPYSAFRAQAS